MSVGKEENLSSSTLSTTNPVTGDGLCVKVVVYWYT